MVYVTLFLDTNLNRNNWVREGKSIFAALFVIPSVIYQINIIVDVGHILRDVVKIFAHFNFIYFSALNHLMKSKHYPPFHRYATDFPSYDNAVKSNLLTGDNKSHLQNVFIQKYNILKVEVKLKPN